MLVATASLGGIDWKVVVQLLLGGVVGTLLTYFLNQRAARRKFPRLRVRTHLSDYSAAACDPSLGTIHISYRGRSFSKLLLYEFELVNVSARTAQDTQFLFTLPADAEVIERNCSIEPVQRVDKWISTVDPKVYLWQPGVLRKGDRAILRLLLNAAGEVSWRFRGDDDYEVVSAESIAPNKVSREARLVLIWLAVYVALGGLPFAAALARALLILMTAPFVAARIAQWRAALDVPQTRIAATAPETIKDDPAANDESRSEKDAVM